MSENREEYRILRKTPNGDWINLYPPIPNGKPQKFINKEKAENFAIRLKKNFGVQTKIVGTEEALEYEVPKRDYLQ